MSKPSIEYATLGQSPRTLGIGRTIESTTTKAACTLESGYSVL